MATEMPDAVSEREPSLGMPARAPMGTVQPAIQMSGIAKRFGSVVALDGVDFGLRQGEIHVLLGENGAGKTTLMRILFGMLRPDAGSIMIGGQEVHFRSPRDALARRIGMVHQHFMLVPNMTVAENVVIGSRPAWHLRFSPAQVREEVRRAAASFHLELDVARPVGDLSVDLQQRVEILKLLYRGAETLILDEPTGALGPNEVRRLFQTLQDLRGRGHSIVVITHKLSEAVEVADRVTVLRSGRVVTTVARGDFDEGVLARAMLGHELRAVSKAEDGDGARSPRLEVRDLVVNADHGHRAIDGVSLTVMGGEILGVAGVEGNGQVELAQALAGLRKPVSGRVAIDGVEVSLADPRHVHARGVSVVSENRLQWDLVLDLTLAENLALGAVASGRYSRLGLLHRQRIKADARKLLRQFDVRPPDPNLPAAALSGGNQQKLVLARELARQPGVLIVSQPTRGLDMGATEFVHQQLLALRDQGGAVLLISLDLDELLTLSDRVVVLYRGRIVYHRGAGEVTMDEIAAAMTGIGAGPAGRLNGEVG
jgi:ABC-type uncharacterized transport system ATPase subunit